MPRKSWWARLPFGVRMAAGTCALLAAIGGGVTGIVALTGGAREKTVADAGAPVPAPSSQADDPLPLPGDYPAAPSRLAPPHPQAAAQQRLAAPAPAAPRPASPGHEVADHAMPGHAARDHAAPGHAAPDHAAPGHVQAADAHAPAPPRAGAPAAPVPPARTTRTDVEVREIPFETRIVQDPALDEGLQRVRSPGANGQETRHYLVTLVDGQPVDRQLVDATVTRQPQQRIVAYGTRPPANRPSRSGCKHSALDLCVPLGRSGACREADPPMPDQGDAFTGGADVSVFSGDPVEYGCRGGR
jgi:hypothetical protein